MKSSIIILLSFIVSLSASAKQTDISKIWCGYWDNPNNNARLWVSFEQKQNKIIATVNRSRDLSDESQVDTLYSATVNVTESKDLIQVNGPQGFNLQIQKPVADWNKGSTKGAQLKIKSYAINTGIQCENQN